MKPKMKFSVALSFESIHIPPFEDILLVTKKCPQGKEGVLGAFNLLAPDRFELIEIKDGDVELLLVNRTLLKRMSADKIIEVLRKNVFPYVMRGEVIKVDFGVKISYDAIEGTLE